MAIANIILISLNLDTYVINWWESDGQFKVVDYISVKLAKIKTIYI